MMYSVMELERWMDIDNNGWSVSINFEFTYKKSSKKLMKVERWRCGGLPTSRAAGAGGYMAIADEMRQGLTDGCA